MADELKANAKPNRHQIVSILVWLAFFVYAGHCFSHMVAAGDTWVAMACGRHFSNHGVDTVEPFSANSHSAGPTEEELEPWPEFTHGFLKEYHPTGWINQNWLTQLIFFEISGGDGSKTNYDDLNYNAMVVWKFIICLLVICSVYYASRLLGAGKINAAVFAAISVFVGRSFYDIRPAVFSNLLVPAFILILLLSQRRNRKFIWLSVPLIVFWGNVHGGYLYAFITMFMFWAINLIVWKFKPRFCRPCSGKLIIDTMLAGAASFIAMVILNPYHLTNLTHTFIITVSEHASEWKDVNEWHSAFELSNPVGTSIPFIILLGLGGASLLVWGIITASQLQKSGRQPANKTKNTPEKSQAADTPKIDPAYLAIVLFSLWMAVSSRRFIPIASAAFCPLLAMIAQQTIDKISNKLSAMPERKRLLEKISIAAFAAFVLIPGVLWAGKFKKVYLDPFCLDDTYNSIFMRMTASYAKPFEACEYIRKNNLSGNMLNYWTEGGFIAFMQNPNPDNGFIPLKLFMDGRAQAAYDIEMFRTYKNEIMSGGAEFKRIAQKARRERKRLSSFKQELKDASEKMDERLNSKGVWIYLMPSNAVKSGFMTLMRYNSDWKPVYIDGKQSIFVDTDTDKGLELYKGLFNGNAQYPSEDIRETSMIHYLIGSKPEEAYRRARKLYEKSGELLAMKLLTDAARTKELKEKAYKYCKSEISDFIKEKDQLHKQHGYINKYSIADMCLKFVIENGKDFEDDKSKISVYKSYRQQLKEETQQIREETRW
ncbi:hypothetical protein [Sedimentisphaera salicampi]|uniref:hypothetical protein n=1 Tax=Sedimentisphaera salicampi TaxID=1941349 RepID=UPI000B9C4825|nr:hypothetical protein [Sedimentisphaera salicampi]OXU14065.1 hypothetical protein SMSP1_02227 [Sedimentisphaera salicampi]